MTTTSTSLKPIYLLAVAMGLGISCAVIAVSMSALFAQTLTDTLATATLPYGLQFVCTMIMSYVAAMAVGRFGRKTVILSLNVIGIVSGIIGVISVNEKSFVLLCLCHALMGCFFASVQMLRFSALDMVDKSMRSRALSCVLSGGILGSFLAPLLLRSAPFANEIYASAYYSIILMAFVSLVILWCSALPTKPSIKKKEKQPTSFAYLFNTPNYLIAVICGSLGYGSMSILMINAGLEMHEHNINFNDISFAIQLHVLLMYLPSLKTGSTIERLGIKKFLTLGACLLIITSLIALTGQHKLFFYATLMLLGLAWNFLYTGGSLLATNDCNSQYRLKAQGVCDFIISLTAACSSLFSGYLLATLGWSTLNITIIVLAIIVLFFIQSKVKITSATS